MCPCPKDGMPFPGARGCTPQSCSFRDHYRELQQLGAEVVGLSNQTRDYQKEMAERLHLPFAVLSDHEMKLANALDLPTFEVAGMTLLKRLTLICRNGLIEGGALPGFPDRSGPCPGHGLPEKSRDAGPERDDRRCPQSGYPDNATSCHQSKVIVLSCGRPVSVYFRRFFPFFSGFPAQGGSVTGLSVTLSGLAGFRLSGIGIVWQQPPAASLRVWPALLLPSGFPVQAMPVLRFSGLRHGLSG